MKDKDQMFTKRAVASLLLLLSLLLAACAGAASPSEADLSAEIDTLETEVAAQTTLRPVTLAMGYIPNVQFAPFYVAVERGYFADEGIEISFDYGMENDLLQLVAANERQFVVGSGDQALLGRSRGLPVRYVMNWYRRFPVAVTSIEHDLSDPAALQGLTVGLPGLFGANYIGWLALAQAAGLDAEAVTLEAIGFAQVPVLVAGQVDAAVVYATNEPLQLAAEGYSPSTLLVADWIDLVANGLISNETTIQQEPELVRAMVRAIGRGIADTLADPDAAFAIARAPRWGTEISDETAEAQRAVLEASLPFWQNPTPGRVPRSAWETSHQFMLDAGLLDAPLNLDEVYTDEFVPVTSDE